MARIVRTLQLFLEITTIIRHICIFRLCSYIRNYVQNNCAFNDPKLVLIQKVLKKYRTIGVLGVQHLEDVQYVLLW